MTTKTCDICKSSCEELLLLLDIYQQKNIKEVCNNCAKLVNQTLDKINNIQRIQKQRQMILKINSMVQNKV